MWVWDLIQPSLRDLYRDPRRKLTVLRQALGSARHFEIFSDLHKLTVKGRKNRARRKGALLLPCAPALLNRLISQNSPRRGTVCVIYFCPHPPLVSRCSSVGNERRTLAASIFMEMQVEQQCTVHLVCLCVSVWHCETCPEVEFCHVRCGPLTVSRTWTDKPGTSGEAETRPGSIALLAHKHSHCRVELKLNSAKSIWDWRNAGPLFNLLFFPDLCTPVW